MAGAAYATRIDEPAEVSAYQTSLTDVPGGTSSSGGTSDGSTSREKEAGVPGGTPIGSIDGLAVGEGGDDPGGVAEGVVDAVTVTDGDGDGDAFPPHPTASTTSVAVQIARRMHGSLSAPT